MAFAARSRLSRWWQAALDLVYPRNCQACLRAVPEGQSGILCGECLATVRFIEPPFCSRCALPYYGAIEQGFVCGYCGELEFQFRRAVAACRAEGLVRDCIHRFKYDRQLYYGPYLAQWLIQAGRRWIDWTQVDGVVAVPLHPRKRRARQFNQADYLARQLARAVGQPLLGGVVQRIRDTPTQTHLDAVQRRANLRDAFAVRQAGPLRGRRLVLVDDVFTTGATLDACASVLRQAGTVEVLVLTVARGV